jgi:hypothetical protein
MQSGNQNNEIAFTIDQELNNRESSRTKVEPGEKSSQELKTVARQRKTTPWLSLCSLTGRGTLDSDLEKQRMSSGEEHSGRRLCSGAQKAKPTAREWAAGKK